MDPGIHKQIQQLFRNQPQLQQSQFGSDELYLSYFSSKLSYRKQWLKQQKQM